jgi:serine O-acetyltransferase
MNNMPLQPGFKPGRRGIFVSVRQYILTLIYFLEVLLLITDKIILRLSGGIWGVKKKCCRQSRFQRHYIRCFNRYFDARGSYIGYQCKFYDVPTFPHGMLGIFISGYAEIGRDCVIFHQVTIGSNTLPDSKGKGAPKIGNNCYIGAGAMIIGNVTVGNNVRIGANCVVFKDIPDNSVVVAQPPRVIVHEQFNNRYYSRNANGEWVYRRNGEWIRETDEETLASLNE